MPTSDEPLLQSIEQTDVLIVREMPRFFGYNEDFVFPHTILTLILSGSARAMYDMRVITHHKNDLTIIRSGHIMHPLDCTEDFTYALLFISPKMLDDLRFHTFSHDHKKFDYAPVCSLTDEQAAHLLTIVDQLVVIANHTDKELPHRYQTLLAQLAVGYEFLNYYRRDQDRQWAENRHTDTSGNSLYAWLHRTHILLPIFQARHRHDSKAIPRQHPIIMVDGLRLLQPY